MWLGPSHKSHALSSLCFLSSAAATCSSVRFEMDIHEVPLELAVFWDACISFHAPPFPLTPPLTHPFPLCPMPFRHYQPYQLLPNLLHKYFPNTSQLKHAIKNMNSAQSVRIGHGRKLPWGGLQPPASPVTHTYIFTSFFSLSLFSWLPLSSGWESPGR